MEKKPHHLAEFAGMFTYDEGQEMIDCINREFTYNNK